MIAPLRKPNDKKSEKRRRKKMSQEYLVLGIITPESTDEEIRRIAEIIVRHLDKNRETPSS